MKYNEAEIEDIGKKLVSCKEQCEGIVNEPQEGILPRCLIFEAEGRGSDRSSVIVGLNPGHTQKGEWAALRNGSYGDFVKYWEENGSKHPYYKKLKCFVDELGLRGPILWTELVKCESKEGIPLPVQTIRTCIRKYLNEELKLIAQDCPLIAAGREAYKVLAYRFPDHIVIGVPHPTGSHGQFERLRNNQYMLNQVKSSLSELWDGEKGKAVWVDVDKEELT